MKWMEWWIASGQSLGVVAFQNVIHYMRTENISLRENKSNFLRHSTASLFATIRIGIVVFLMRYRTTVASDAGIS